MNRGFTLIELMICIAILAIIGAAVASWLGITTGSTSGIQWGVNGMTETRCIDGSKFVVGQNGHITQMLDAQGRAIQCR